MTRAYNDEMMIHSFIRFMTVEIFYSINKGTKNDEFDSFSLFFMRLIHVQWCTSPVM